MKKISLMHLAAFSLAIVMSIAMKPAASGKAVIRKMKAARDQGPVWINCNKGYVHACSNFVEHYYVMDGQTGDTYDWFWDPDEPGWPTMYLGSGPSTDISLGLGDRLIVKVNSIDYGEYEYYDTATECDE